MWNVLTDGLFGTESRTLQAEGLHPELGTRSSGEHFLGPSTPPLAAASFGPASSALLNLETVHEGRTPVKGIRTRFTFQLALRSRACTRAALALQPWASCSVDALAPPRPALSVVLDRSTFALGEQNRKRLPVGSGISLPCLSILPPLQPKDLVLRDTQGELEKLQVGLGGTRDGGLHWVASTGVRASLRQRSASGHGTRFPGQENFAFSILSAAKPSASPHAPAPVSFPGRVGSASHPLLPSDPPTGPHPPTPRWAVRGAVRCRGPRRSPAAAFAATAPAPSRRHSSLARPRRSHPTEADLLGEPPRVVFWAGHLHNHPGCTLLASTFEQKHKGADSILRLFAESVIVLKMGPVGTEVDENHTVEEVKVESYAPGRTTPRGELLPDPEPELIDSTKLVEVQVVLILAYCSIIVLGVVGNSLVIHVVIKFKSMRTVTNFFIANLAVADLLVNTLCLPFTLTYTLMGEWKMGPVLCHLVPYAQGLAVQVSTITLTVIALDRHRCIVYHLESKISKRLSFLIIGLAWGISALLASPLAIFREYSLIEIIPDFEIVACTEKWPGEERNMYGTIYSLSSLLILYVLPLGIISFSYTRIWSKLKNHVSPGAASDHYHQRRHKMTKMLVCVVVVFAVSWLPLHAFQLAVDIDNQVLDLKEYKLIFTVLHIIAMCSTFANPFLYGWMNSNYRKAFLSAFRCEQRLDAIHSEVSMTFKAKKNLEVKKNSGLTDSFSEATNV